MGWIVSPPDVCMAIHAPILVLLSTVYINAAVSCDIMTKLRLICLSFWAVGAVTWSAQTTWWRRSTTSGVKSLKPRSDASSCSMMFSCVPHPISGKSRLKPHVFLICALICAYLWPWLLHPLTSVPFWKEILVQFLLFCFACCKGFIPTSLTNESRENWKELYCIKLCPRGDHSEFGPMSAHRC